MTTATIIADTLAKKRQQLTALGDGRDLRSDHERAVYRHAYGALQGAVSVLMNVPADIAAVDAKIAPLQAALDRERQAEATLDQQLADASDWRLVVDRRERDRAWAEHQGLLASKTALHRGVEFFNGQPALPAPLRALLSDTCSACGHSTLHWAGPTDDLVAQLAKLTTKRDALQQQLDAALLQAEAPVTGEAGMEDEASAMTSS